MSEIDDVPTFTTGFSVLQTLDGEVVVVPESGLDQNRQPSTQDVYMLCSFVAKSLENQIMSPPPPPRTTAQTLQDKLAERNADG